MAVMAKKLPASEMLAKLKETASHLGMDDDEAAVFTHKGMKRAGYKVSPAYSDPDDSDDDDDDEDDLMPRRRNKTSGSGNNDTGRKKASGDGIWD